MSNFWKIQNQTDQDIKVAVAVSSNGSSGVILKPNEFCVSIDQLTRMVDIQEKREYIKVYRSYKNKQNYELGVAISDGPIELAKKQTDKYTGK
jgi:hypothetical protein